MIFLSSNNRCLVFFQNESLPPYTIEHHTVHPWILYRTKLFCRLVQVKSCSNIGQCYPTSNHHPADKSQETNKYCAIQWIEMYTLDIVSYPLNNWRQINTPGTSEPLSHFCLQPRIVQLPVIDRMNYNNDPVSNSINLSSLIRMLDPSHNIQRSFPEGKHFFLSLEAFILEQLPKHKQYA